MVVSDAENEEAEGREGVDMKEGWLDVKEGMETTMKVKDKDNCESERDWTGA